MKREFLEEMGLSKDQIDQILDANSSDIGKAKQNYDTVKAEGRPQRRSFRRRIVRLIKFKDYDQIKGQVDDYRQKFEASEAEKLQIQQNYEFNGKLEAAAKKYGARALKAIVPYLDVDNLKKSQNQDTDIDNALKALKESEDSAFLFGANEPINNPVAGSGGGKDGGLDAVAKAMGLTEKDFEK